MLFVGAIPRDCVSQAFRVIDVDQVTDAYVCCSGSFRFEQALTKYHPNVRIHSNDVSLLSVMLGRALRDEPVEVTFHSELAFIERALEEGDGSVLDRLAGVILAVRLSHFAGSNPYARRHFAHFTLNVRHYLDQARARAEGYLAGVKIESFFAGDFREHAERATAPGSFIFAWPPTYAGGYERLYKLIDQNSTWSPPSYGVFDPSTLTTWIEKLEAQNQRYVVYADQDLAGRRPHARYQQGRQKPASLYTNAARAVDIRTPQRVSKPFGYTPIDVSKITRDSVLTVVPVDARRMDFIKDVYLMAGLVHSDGAAGRFLVFIDGMLAGGFAYDYFRGALGFTDPRISNQSSVYILCDFACSRERRLSKLIATLTTGHEQFRAIERKRVMRVESIVTTAWTDKPVSMKYRGIFELISRKPGMLNYMSVTRKVSNRAIFEDWYDRHARNER